MAKLYNLARMSTATSGTGTITLGSAVSGYLTFAQAGVTDGQTVTYAIKDGANSEIGRGVYTAAGTTLSRTVLKSTNAGSAISLSGSAEVFITAAAEDFFGINDLADPAADRVLFWDDSAGILTWLSLSGLTITGTSLAVDAASDTAAGVVEIAVQSEQETATDTTRAVTPGRQHYHPSAAKFWVKWGVTTTIDASYNTSSITDTGTGDWTVNINTDFSSANWVASYNNMSGNEFANPVYMCGLHSTGMAAGTLRCFTRDSTAPTTSMDSTKNLVAGYGDHA